MESIKGYIGAQFYETDPSGSSGLRVVRSSHRYRWRFGPGICSSTSIGSAIGQLWLQGLPDDYYQQYGARIGAVTKADMMRVAKQYIDLDHLSIVIVGDRATIEGPLKATGIASIVVLDIEGNVVK